MEGLTLQVNRGFSRDGVVWINSREPLDGGGGIPRLVVVFPKWMDKEAQAQWVWALLPVIQEEIVKRRCTHMFPME